MQNKILTWTLASIAATSSFAQVILNQQAFGGTGAIYTLGSGADQVIMGAALGQSIGHGPSVITESTLRLGFWVEVSSNETSTPVTPKSPIHAPQIAVQFSGDQIQIHFQSQNSEQGVVKLVNAQGKQQILWNASVPAGSFQVQLSLKDLAMTPRFLIIEKAEQRRTYLFNPNPSR